MSTRFINKLSTILRKLPRTFSVRSMLLVVAVCAVVTGFFGREWVALQRQWAIARDLASHGNLVLYNVDAYKVRPVSAPANSSLARRVIQACVGAHRAADVYGVDFVHPLTEEDVQSLGKLPSLRVVTLLDCQAPQAVVASLARIDSLRCLRVLVSYNPSRTATLCNSFDLAEFSQIECLEVVGISIDGEFGSRIAKMRGLKELRIESCTLLVGSLDELANSDGIESIHIRFSTIPENMLSTLARMRTLRRLDLRGSNITDKGATAIGSLLNLAALDLADTRVSDDGMLSLARLESLKELDLSKTGITNIGLARLRGLRTLEMLDLSDTKIADGLGPYLLEFPSLQSLTLKGTKISVNEVAELQGRVPHVVAD